MDVEDGFSSGSGGGVQLAPQQSVSEMVQSSSPPAQEQQQQQQQTSPSSYAARRYGAAAAGGGGGGAGGSSSPNQQAENRVPLKIPTNLVLDPKRIILGSGVTLGGGSPTTSSASPGSPGNNASFSGNSSAASDASSASGKGSGDVIGTGSFGTVLRGELMPDPSSPSSSSSQGEQAEPIPIAIKVLDKAKAENSSFMNLQAELDVSGELRHPCLVNTLGVIAMSAAESPIHSESIAIVMELANRGELLKYMKRYGLEDMPEVAPKFVAEAVLALEFMASKNLVHRDLKPENLLLTAECHVKLSDFGTVCALNAPDASVFRGTTAYAAPEVLTPGGSVAITTDLWALGCVVYELFVGRPPFQAESDYLLRQVIRGREFEFPPYFPAAAKDLVSNLLEMDPNKRIGAASRGGFAALKQHAFFAHVCWETLLQQSHVTSLNADYQAEVGPLLLDKEEIIFAGHIKKERYFSTKQRLLVLTSFPRLFYIEPGSFNIKGSIPLVDETCAEQVNANKFNVHTGEGNRTYLLEDTGGNAATWCAKVNSMIMDMKAKKRVREQLNKKQ